MRGNTRKTHRVLDWLGLTRARIKQYYLFFSGQFFANRFTSPICDDSEPDINKIYMRTVRAIKAAGADNNVEKLDRPLVFEMVATTNDGISACFTCTNTVYQYTTLKIRDIAAQVPRNVK